MDRHILSMDLRALTRSIDRYLGETMPPSACDATGGNAHIIMFLARNRDRDVYQHTIEQKFCITRSTASRVLALMEKKGMIVRESVDHDARLKKIVLTDQADAIVNDLRRSGADMERRLMAGLSAQELETLASCIARMRANLDDARREFQNRQPDRRQTAAAPQAGEPARGDMNETNDKNDKKEESK
ncbi:MarR family winged helix-turn-helix transcriptional regulator [Bifidobacterium samirii]|uniref:Transcriptional regulator, MarR family n=1 Tax=Bifidobacterium samirii TaxID=2306974 RepID=A0A430FWG5_9BIFI|nr:MarR family transcriptional regulator [Bifidobacterium samirii]RSX58720.1 Transcriptional regulator, MarR family [Bifidobacterium samirii]